MTSFTIIASLILFGLTFLCFWLPFKSGQKKTGLIVSVFIAVIVSWTIIGDLDFLVIFIWPTILAFQIVFLSYWTFRLFELQKIGAITAVVLATGFLLFAMQPWITDWTFNKKDAKKILSWHGIELKDDFDILENESGGFRDYAHTFNLKISESDYEVIANEIRSSNNFEKLNSALTNQEPMAVYNSTDTINFETEHYVKREYYTKDKMPDGTFHFIYRLSKKERELNYFGINE